MNEEKQRIAIAEACGWEIYRDTTSEPECWIVQNKNNIRKVGSHKTRNQAFLLTIPDYLNDLNECHEMEKVLEAEQMTRYLAYLSGGSFNLDAMFKHIATATAAQKCNALLRAIDKWEDSE